MSSSARTDVVVVGAGPVGLFSVFACGMLKLRCHVVDVLDVLGGQCGTLYPDKPIYDIPACPDLTGGGLIEKLEQQIQPFAPVFHLDQRVEAIASDSTGGFCIRTSKGADIRAKAVLIAGGNGAFKPNRPPLPGIAELEGASVFYAVKNKSGFAGKRVVIAGGGDSAVDWAIELSELASHVTIVHRRAAFRAAPHAAEHLATLAAAGRVTVAKPYQLHRLRSESGLLRAVEIAHLDGSVQELAAEALLLFFGLSSSLGPIAGWDLELRNGRIAVDPATMATSRPGVFAAGDIAEYPGKLKLILCGFSEAAMASHAIAAFVRPGEFIDVQHSTTTGIPVLA